MHSILSLVFFDWFSGTFEKLRSYQKDFWPILIHVDVTEPTRFVLSLDNTDQHFVCNVDGKMIQFGEPFTINNNSGAFAIYNSRIYHLNSIVSQYILFLVSNFYAFSSKLPSLTLRAILKVRLNLR